MTLALFDLDNTLIAGDSDHAWGQFLVNNQLVDVDEYGKRNDQFYQDYQNGCLDVAAYLRFALEPLSRFSKEELATFHHAFMKNSIAPLRLTSADELIAKHRAKNHRPVVITATNRFVVEPIITAMGISDIICSEPEVIGERYTGNFIDEPCFQKGKITKLNRWLEDQSETLADAWFYSDSFNDIPLLEQVDHPVAVDPDDQLRAHAERSGWPIISLR